jgi:predicted GTPase
MICLGETCVEYERAAYADQLAKVLEITSFAELMSASAKSKTGLTQVWNNCRKINKFWGVSF